jgi:hypothetical protein
MFVGADGRPMTGAVGMRSQMHHVGGGHGEGGEEEEGVVGQHLALKLIRFDAFAAH